MYQTGTGTKKQQVRLVINDEHCDNLLIKTTEFLAVVLELKKAYSLDIHVEIADQLQKDHCIIVGSQIYWGFPQISKILDNIIGHVESSLRSEAFESKKQPNGQLIQSRNSKQIMLSKEMSSLYDVKKLTPGNDVARSDISDYQNRIMNMGDEDKQQDNQPKRTMKQQQQQQQNPPSRQQTQYLSPSNDKSSPFAPISATKSMKNAKDNMQQRLLSRLKEGGD